MLLLIMIYFRRNYWIENVRDKFMINESRIDRFLFDRSCRTTERDDIGNHISFFVYLRILMIYRYWIGLVELFFVWQQIVQYHQNSIVHRNLKHWMNFSNNFTVHFFKYSYSKNSNYLFQVHQQMIVQLYSMIMMTKILVDVLSIVH
jgi:hypothetical protein